MNATNAQKSAKQIATELRQDVKMRFAEGFADAENEQLIDGGSSLILRVGGLGGTDVEIKFIVKKDQFDIQIQAEEVEEVVEETTEETTEEVE